MAFNVRMLKRDDIGASLIAAWDALEARACQPNAYLSSSFVLPALEHLTASADVRIVVVEEPADAAKPAALLGLGIFKLQAPTRTLPVRHLASYECIHSYLGGLLIDREYSVATLNALFRFLAQPGGEWHAVLFSKFPSDGFWAESCLRQAEACGLAWHETSSIQRSVLTPAAISQGYLRSRLSSRSKDCARLLRHLTQKGNVTWDFERGEQVSGEHVERFLELENKGWKSEQGTSLLSRPHEARFFREVMSGFQRRGQSFFTELKVDGRAIASTSNFISGTAGFAFKVGWDCDFARYSPGILNEFEFLRQASERCGDLDYLDSGAAPGSYIDSMWLERRTLVSGIYPTSSLGEKAVAAMNLVRRLIQHG